MEFNLLLKLKELEKETNFHFVFDRDNQEIYLFEPNSKESFDKINIQEYLKESENGNPIKRPDSTSVERCSSNVIGRIRGIIKEREDRSRAEIGRSEEIQTGSRGICKGRESICRINGEEIWRRDFEARVSLQELQTRSQRLEETNHFIRQSQPYKQQALESYQKQLGATIAPNSNHLESTLKSNQEVSHIPTQKTNQDSLLEKLQRANQEVQSWQEQRHNKQSDSDDSTLQDSKENKPHKPIIHRKEK